jgi:3D-(3,5/4)-trihydroxycyclohexane-1,2-dione acylhydrolase (decyclizing)
MTMAQALVGFLKEQYVERDGVERRFFHGAWGIFGHGCIAGLGQALQQNPDFRYYQCKNEQAAVHIAAAFAKANNRLGTFACISSIGPGATNMVTGAATATINRLPVLLLPGDIFARRNVAPVLQQLESEQPGRVGERCSAGLALLGPDQPARPACLLGRRRCGFTSPWQTRRHPGSPQDVQSEAWDYPVEMLEKRVWHIARPEPERALLSRAVEMIRAAKRPIVVAGGGVFYSEATGLWIASPRRPESRPAKPRPARARCRSITR